MTLPLDIESPATNALGVAGTNAGRGCAGTDPRETGRANANGEAAAARPVVQIHVVGEPVGQGRISYGSTGHGYHSNAKTLKPWRRTIRTAAQAHIADLIDGPVAVDLTFTLTRPKTVRRTWPHKRHDIDHLCRAVLDAITGVLITDDSRVCQLYASKVYGAPAGVTIRLFHLTGNQS